MKTYDELLAERDALAAKLSNVIAAWNGHDYDAINAEINKTSQQCLAEIRAEAVETSLDAIGAPITKLLGKSNDFVAGFNYCAALLQRHAAKVRQGSNQ